MMSRKTKVRLLYVVIIRSILTYGYEVSTTTKHTERKLRKFENRVWRKICGPIPLMKTRGTGVGDIGNKELYDLLELAPVTSFIKGQRLQRLGHIMRRGENETVRVALEWKPKGKRPKGRPRKRWIDVVEEDLKILGVEDWRGIVQDR
uniref:Endonuclease-reverse transcriptase n=1 Tax=Schizaphis graminum TaxID=13262 RepID=A0A2S2P2T1_SCHGA